MHMGTKKKRVAETQTDAVTRNETQVEIPTETATEASPLTKPKKGKRKESSGPLTLADLSGRYLTHLAEGEWSGGTIASYSMELKTAMGGLGAQTLLSEITAERVQTYFDCKRVTKLKSGKAKAKPSIDKTRRVLRLALVWAEEAGLVAKAPIPEGPVEAQA